MKFEEITIKITEQEANTPVSNIALLMKIAAQQKNGYNIMLPLSDENGEIHITWGWLSTEIDKERNAFIMDYSSGLPDCGQVIELNLLSVEDMQKTISAMKMYQEILSLSNEDIEKYDRSSNWMFLKCYKSFRVKSNHENWEMKIIKMDCTEK